LRFKDEHRSGLRNGSDRPISGFNIAKVEIQAHLPHGSMFAISYRKTCDTGVCEQQKSGIFSSQNDESPLRARLYKFKTYSSLFYT
jgi:hypothetical protein